MKKVNKKKEIKEILITSRATIDFPKLKFSIRKGEIKKLPKCEIAKKIILSNSNIKLINY